MLACRTGVVALHCGILHVYGNNEIYRNNIMMNDENIKYCLLGIGEVLLGIYEELTYMNMHSETYVRTEAAEKVIEERKKYDSLVQWHARKR